MKLEDIADEFDVCLRAQIIRKVEDPVANTVELTFVIRSEAAEDVEPIVGTMHMTCAELADIPVDSAGTILSMLAEHVTSGLFELAQDVLFVEVSKNAG